MGLDTQYPENLLIGDDAVVWGTAMLGTAFGQVKSASLDRNADQQQILNGNTTLRALILTNPRTALSLTTTFDEDVTAPGLGEEVSFPLVGVTGRITSVKPAWSENGARELQIEASHWDSLDNGSDAMDAYKGLTSGTFDWVAIV